MTIHVTRRRLLWGGIFLTAPMAIVVSLISVGATRASIRERLISVLQQSETAYRLCNLAGVRVFPDPKPAEKSAFTLRTPIPAEPRVSFDRILNAAVSPENWLTYSGTLGGQRFTRLDEITPENVNGLELKWVYQVRSARGASARFEASPLVVDGVMYVVQPPNDIVALDAATGRVYWIYEHKTAENLPLCCGYVNRGLAILNEALYMGTVDGHLISVHARTGQLLWDVTVAPSGAGYSLTAAPLAIKDKIIIGTAGAEFGIRGFLAAFDARTGRKVWQFNTIPGPGEAGNETWPGDSWMHGGGSIWVTGSYDPDLNLTYWGVGNPGPDYTGDGRIGDNLYTSSVIAVDADTGKLTWHYQFTPHDEFDYDAAHVPVLADIELSGRLRKVTLWGNKNGIWYVLDRVSGEFLFGKPFTTVNWMNGFDEKGRPKRVLAATPQGVLTYPGYMGGTGWYSPSYSPKTRLFYIQTSVNSHAVFRKGPPPPFEEGRMFTGIDPTAPLGKEVIAPKETGAIRAFDPYTGSLRWEFPMEESARIGVLTTTGGLLFSGDGNGLFFALDAGSGALLWKSIQGAPSYSNPISYAVGKKQYVAVSAGGALFSYALR